MVAVVRSEARVAELSARGFEVTRAPAAEVAERYIGDLRRDVHAIVCFPPDGVTDAQLAPLLAGARATSYVSTTGVYGDREGVIDDATPVASSPSASASRVLEAEGLYRTHARAAVLRAPGIYGRERGLHVRLMQGKHSLPGDGAGYVSRIHVEDLAELLLASDAEAVRGETFVVSDLDPVRQRDICAWICAEYGLPFPPSVAPERVHETLRRNRRVDPSRVLATLGVTLRYPSYRDGMKRID